MREVNIKYMMPFRGESDARVDNDGNDRYWEWVLRGQGTCHGYQKGEENSPKDGDQQAGCVFSVMRTEVLLSTICATFSKKKQSEA